MIQVRSHSKKSPKILWENTFFSDEYLFAPIPFKFSISLKEWMNLFSPEMTVDKNAGKQTRASKGKKCFYQSSKKSCPLKAWFFGARKVQSSIIQSDKNHFEESREREDWFEWFTTILDLAVTCFKKNRGERMTVWCEIRAKNDISEGTYCTIVWRGCSKKEIRGFEARSWFDMKTFTYIS